MISADLQKYFFPISFLMILFKVFIVLAIVLMGHLIFFFFFAIFIFFTIDFPPLEIIGLEEEMQVCQHQLVSS